MPRYFLPRPLISSALFAALMLFAPYALAQESRGAISGRVLDPSGALVPGASIAITNVETNTVSRTVSNQSGYFEVSLLNPGEYSISAEAGGFKKILRSGVVLSVAARVDLELQLQIGQSAETVEVTAEAALVNTTSASGGRVINNREIMQLPFSDMNPFALSALSPGMQWTGQPEYRRPFDNGGTSAFNTAGGIGSNEYTIDGAPVTGTGRRVGFVPPSDAVSEFKLETTTFDAAYGHTSGATINVQTKSGTNALHGSLYDQHWQQRWNATPHFTRLAFDADVRAGRRKADDQRQGTGRSNNFGGTLGGPVVLPWLYNGRDKLFFFFSYNGIYQSKAETTDAINRDVPKLAWRQGDFSDLLAIDPVRFQLYDPRSARLVNNRVVRDPFPGNKGIPVLNPMYRFYADLYPTPNDVPGLVNAEGQNNYLGVAMPKDEKFNSVVHRMDYNLSERHRVFGRWYYNKRLADEYDWTYETMRGLHTNGLTRINKGGGGSYIWTISNNLILDLGLSYTRFNEGSDSPVRTQFKPSDVGLPAYLDAKAGDLTLLPRLDFPDNTVEDFSGGYPAITIRGTTAEMRLTLNAVQGNHSVKYGWQERRYLATTGGPGNTSGSFSFGNSWTRQADNTNTAGNIGHVWASFMMGLPTGINIDTNDSAVWQNPWRSFFVHDNWRLTNKLRLDLGLRYEYEGGITERFNRGLAAHYDTDLELPYSALVEQAYARNPLPELAASQFRVRGGPSYLGTDYKDFTNGAHMWLPRMGVVYSWDSKTVISGGYGVYYDTFNVNNDRPRQDGFSQGTGTPLTTDNGLTFCCGIGDAANLSATRNAFTDPFPVRVDGTRFNTAFGNSLGAVIMAGREFDSWPRNFRPAAQQRWRIGVQRQIGETMVVELSYNGAFSRFPRRQRLDFLPQQYWATGNVRRQDIDDALNANVPNPFNIQNLEPLRTSNPLVYQYLSTQGFFTRTTAPKHTLLRPFPQNYSGDDTEGLRPGNDFLDSRGRNRYHDLQARFERRFSRGFQTAVLYTYGKNKETNYINEFDTEQQYLLNNDVRPHRFVWSSIWELPFGKGRRWATSGPMQHVVGGWQLSWIYQRQSGPIVNWGNRFFYGDMNQIENLLDQDNAHGRDIHTWFAPITHRTGNLPQGFVGFEGRSNQQPGSYHVRVFPNQLDFLREDGIRNWDMKVMRKFQITERLNTNFSVDMLNATNHTNFGGPNIDPTNTNFGKVTSQRGLSRVIQFNLRVDF